MKPQLPACGHKLPTQLAGVVNDAGTCCPAAQTPFAPTTLDRTGQCCAQALDACGVCGGSGVAIDFVGTCCTGALDASGLCCPLPNVVSGRV